MEAQRVPIKRHADRWLLTALMLSLLTAGCARQPYSQYPHPTDYSHDTGEVSQDEPDQHGEPYQNPPKEFPEFGRLYCEEPFPAQDYLKPPLNIDDLPQSVNPLLINRKRVIGFTFADGQAALLASPARARCRFDRTGLTAVGVVWSWSEGKSTDKPAVHVVAIDTRNHEEGARGFLIPIDPAVIAQESSEKMAQNIKPVRFAVSRLRAQGGADFSQMPPADVSIRANSVCFRYGRMQFCSQDEYLLSPKSLFPKAYNEQVVHPILNAQRLLQKQPSGPIVRSARAARVLNREDAGNVLAEMAISEIEQPERIKECRPTEPRTCQADIIVAGIEPAGKISADTPMNIGITVIKEKLYGFPSGEKDLQAGSYVIRADMERKNPQLYNRQSQMQGDPDRYQQPLVTVSGITNSGEVITQRIPARLGSYLSENDQQGIVEIFGPCFWGDWICGFWERYKGY